MWIHCSHLEMINCITAGKVLILSAPVFPANKIHPPDWEEQWVSFSIKTPHSASPATGSQQMLTTLSND